MNKSNCGEVKREVDQLLTRQSKAEHDVEPELNSHTESTRVWE